MDKLDGLGASTIVSAFVAGLPMDISASTYLFIIPMLLLFIGLWVDIQSFIKGFIKWYGLIMITMVSLITFTDVEIYSIWGYKDNSEILTYLAHPKEALASSESSPLIPLISGVVLLTIFSWWIFKKYIVHQISTPQLKGNWLSYIGRMIIIPITIGLGLVAIRGGIGLSNMGPGYAYHSQHQIMNHGATNASWNFLYSIQKVNDESPCQYHFMEDEKANERLSEILHQDTNSDTLRILNQEAPNVVLVVLEGWPVDVTGSFGGEEGITPFFDSLATDGIRFTNIYSSGDRLSLIHISEPTRPY